MVIKTAKTVAEYKKIRDERIQSWIDARFEKGCVTWELLQQFPFLLPRLISYFLFPVPSSHLQI